MMLHIDGSEHAWFQDERRHELIVILDDATSEIYYAQLVEAESTRTVMAALREVIDTKGLFCSLYSDRAGHFFVTPIRHISAPLPWPTSKETPSLANGEGSARQDPEMKHPAKKAAAGLGP